MLDVISAYGWSVNLRPIEHCIFGIRSIERKIKSILRTDRASAACSAGSSPVGRTNKNFTEQKTTFTVIDVSLCETNHVNN
jgi:hypothetical protein